MFWFFHRGRSPQSPQTLNRILFVYYLIIPTKSLAFVILIFCELVFYIFRKFWVVLKMTQIPAQILANYRYNLEVFVKIVEQFLPQNFFTPKNTFLWKKISTPKLSLRQKTHFYGKKFVYAKTFLRQKSFSTREKNFTHCLRRKLFLRQNFFYAKNAFLTPKTFVRQTKIGVKRLP